MKSKLVLGLSVLVLACGPEDNVEKLCIANPQGNIEPDKVNITAIRGSTALLNENENDTNIAEAANQDALPSITDITFELHDDIQIPVSDGTQTFTDWVQFEPEVGPPTISFKIDGVAYTIDPAEWLVQWDGTPFAAGLYIYYIVIEDLAQEKVSVIIKEWENYSETCNDVIEITG